MSTICISMFPAPMPETFQKMTIPTFGVAHDQEGQKEELTEFPMGLSKETGFAHFCYWIYGYLFFRKYTNDELKGMKNW